jgi:hypothetical protein
VCVAGRAAAQRGSLEAHRSGDVGDDAHREEQLARGRLVDGDVEGDDVHVEVGVQSVALEVDGGVGVLVARVRIPVRAGHAWRQ